MKRPFLIDGSVTLLLVATLGIVGCQNEPSPQPDPVSTKPESDSSEATHSQPVEPSGEDAFKGLAKKFGGELKGLVDEKSETIKQKIEDKLAEFDTDIESLEAQAVEAGEEGAARWKELKPELIAKKDQLVEKFNEIQKAGPAKWLEMKDELESAWEDLKQALNKAKDAFQ